jgi:AcrR family transcriptional regulator
MVERETVTDPRKGPRRRGDELRNAIFAATLAELLDVGYAELTMDRIAEHAKTSKASLYRRWPTRAELVMDAYASARPDPAPAPNTGSLREDALILLQQATALMAGPAGEVTRGVLADALRHPDLLQPLRNRILDSRRSAFREVLQQAVDRGDAMPSAMHPRIVSLCPALLRHYFILNGPSIPDEVIVDIVDHVLLPLCLVDPPVSAKEQRSGDAMPTR